MTEPAYEVVVWPADHRMKITKVELETVLARHPRIVAAQVLVVGTEAEVKALSSENPDEALALGSRLNDLKGKLAVGKERLAALEGEGGDRYG